MSSQPGDADPGPLALAFGALIFLMVAVAIVVGPTLLVLSARSDGPAQPTQATPDEARERDYYWWKKCHDSWIERGRNHPPFTRGLSDSEIRRECGPSPYPDDPFNARSEPTSLGGTT